jgi:hypothetical protein
MSEEEDGIYKVDTVPPPDGEDDAYSAPTRVGVMPESLVAEIMHAAELKSAALREKKESQKRAASASAASEVLASPAAAPQATASPASSSSSSSSSSPSSREVLVGGSASRARASKPDHLPASASNAGVITDADLLLVESLPPPPRAHDVEEGDADAALGSAARPREVTAPLPPELVNAARVAVAAKEAAAAQLAIEASRLAAEPSFAAPSFAAPQPPAPALQRFKYLPLVVGLALFFVGLALYAFR